VTGPVAIWQQLAAEGRVEGPAPALPGTATPWPLRLLAGAGAWIATPLLLGFVALLLGDLLLQPSAALVLGPVLAAAPLVWLRRPASDFVHQAATVASLVGLLLFGFGASQTLGLGDRAVAGVLLLAAAALFAASREPVHRFACAGVAISAGGWWLVGPGAAGLALLAPLLAWLAVAAWLAQARLEPFRHRMWREALPPLAWALTLAAVLVAWLQPALHALGDADADLPARLVVARWLGPALLPALVAVLLWPRRTALGPVAPLALLLASVVLALCWRGSPAISVAMPLLLVAFAAGGAALLALALAALATGLVGYYYQLPVPLLDKALGLAIAGALLAVLHLGLRRWPGGRPR
jgi:hypothetical protein